MNETVIYFGGELKALDDAGKVGGLLVRFRQADERDLTGEYFTAKSYLGPTKGDGADVLFHHGIPVSAELKGYAEHIFSNPVKTSLTDLGLWAETVLDQADAYESKVFELVKAGKLGWSSGSTSRVVRKSADGEIERWPIIEASLTHKPCEPLNRAIAIKSVQWFDELLVADEIKAIDETENEYRYRIKEPSLFEDDSFRTITIKKDKPIVKAVIGKLKGETSTTLQAYRFAKDEWTKKEAEAWAKEHSKSDMKKSFDSDMSAISSCPKCNDNFIKGLSDYLCAKHTTKAVSGAEIFTQNLTEQNQTFWRIENALC